MTWPPARAWESEPSIATSRRKEALLMELIRQKFRLFADRAREALDTGEEPFEALVGVMRRNAETAAADAATQLAIAGAGEQIWIQAQAEQEELLELTDELIARRAATGRSAPISGRPISAC